MTSPATPFQLDGDLIVVDVSLTGPSGAGACRLVLDTGAAMTTIIPEVAERLGYSARDGIARTRVSSAIGSEEGYVLRAAAITALGVSRADFAVHVFDLGHGIDGLLGMNFLDDLDVEIRSHDRVIIVNGGRAANARISRALDAAVADAKAARERAASLEARNAQLRKRLEAARRSTSFRIGRATRLALDGELISAPKRWLDVYRGEDEILDEMEEAPVADRATEAADPDLVLAGAPPLRALATLKELTPHGWSAALERDPPTLVLVTAADLAQGTPWGDWGTPGGRDGLALVGELVAWCRARGIPVAFAGTPVPRIDFDVVLP